jgi:hypothetical protein
MKNTLKPVVRLIACVLFCVIATFTAQSENPTPSEMNSAIKKGMEYLKDKEGVGGPQYSDYVVFCGLSVEKRYPEYKEVIAPYKKWIIKKDRFKGKGPYLYFSACHVMALDVIGETEKAKAMAEKFKPYANGGKWSGISYHCGWYLYSAIVADNQSLADETYKILYDICEKTPNRYQHFVAYCALKTYEKTKNGKYLKFFLMIMNNLKQYEGLFLKMAKKDGHMGMTLYDFSIAYKLTKNEEYKTIAAKLARVLLDTQMENGSWNNKTAYTIMPVEGLTAYNMSGSHL